MSWSHHSMRLSAASVIAIATGVAAFAAWPGTTAAGVGRPVPAPVLDEMAAEGGPETLVLAGGCFWGVQGVFQHVRGVISAVSGYDGGQAGTARYEMVSTGATGHAEAVRITYDPRVVTTGQLLHVFFSVATDPTQRDRQFPDTGPQYRSVVFATTPGQARVARAYIAQLDTAQAFAAPIVTAVTDDTGFHAAEDYHQDYLTRHPASPYIAMFDLPKVQALRTTFPDLYRPDAVLVDNRQP